MIRFLHLADLHLGASPALLGPLAQERSKDYLNAFERAVDYAVEPDNRIDFVIIAGDFFDSHQPSQDVIRFAIGQLKRLQQTKTPTILAPGNHDALGMPNCVYSEGYGFRKLVHLIETPNIQLVLSLDIREEKVNIYGMAWDFHRSHPPFDDFQKRPIDGYHIAIAHGTMVGSLFAEAHSRDVPLGSKNLADSGMDYIALGHIHSFQKTQAGEIPVVYPGTLESRSFSPGEEGDRYLVVVELEENQSPTVEKIKWNSKTYQNLKLDTGKHPVESQDEMMEYIAQNYRGLDKLIRIELIGDTSFVIDSEKLLSQLSGDFFWLVIEDKTNVFDNDIIENWAQEDTIRGLYIRKLKEQLQFAHTEDKKDQINLALKLAVRSFQKTA